MREAPGRCAGMNRRPAVSAPAGATSSSLVEVLGMSSIARSCLAVLVCSVIARPLLAGCGPEKRRLPVNRDWYKEVQEFVNDGHEPWRQDAMPVAAEEVLTLEHRPQQDWDVFAVPLKLVEET